MTCVLQEDTTPITATVDNKAVTKTVAKSEPENISEQLDKVQKETGTNDLSEV